MLRLASSSFLVLSLLSLLGAAPAAAQEPESYGVSSRPVRNWYAGGGLGGTFDLDGGPALFVLNEEVGYQLDPIDLGGAADLQLRFGLDLAQQFGDFYLLQFGARVTASFGVWSNGDLTLRVAPSVVLGGAVFIVEEVCTAFGCFGGGSEGVFNFQFATQAELDLLEGMLTVYFRPLAIDGFFRDGSSARWNLLAGALVHF